MSRWQPDARGRLEDAARELYVERGFDQTTVAQIAERAGLTERTFFRHFSDKREVLFDRSGALHDLLVARLSEVPESAPPIEAATVALEAVCDLLQQNPARARQRQVVIAANPELQERELIKLSSLAAALADGLRGRGAAEATAGLVAQTGIAVFKVAFERWAADPATGDLVPLIRQLLGELNTLTESSPAGH